MSKLHIIFKLSIDLYNVDKKFVSKISVDDNDNELVELVLTELHNYTMPWIRRLFLIENISVITCGFNHIDNKYHLWVENTDGSNVRSAQLSKAIYFAKPKNSSWYNSSECNILHKDDLKKFKLGLVKLVPEVDKILVVSEQEVNLDKLK